MTLFVQVFNCFEMWPWWQYVRHHPKRARECRTMMRLVVGEHCLATNVGSHNSNKGYVSRTCQICPLHIREDVHHFLFDCISVRGHVECFWQELANVAPPQMFNAMQSMSAFDVTVFCFSGFQSKYVPEWDDLYHVICTYIYKVYTIRQSVYLSQSSNK